MFHVKHHSVKVRARISTKAPPLPAISIFPITRANSSNVSRETSLCNPNTEEQCTECTRNTTQPLPHHEYHSATNHHDEPAPQATIGVAFADVSRETWVGSNITIIFPGYSPRQSKQNGAFNEKTSLPNNAALSWLIFVRFRITSAPHPHSHRLISHVNIARYRNQHHRSSQPR